MTGVTWLPLPTPVLSLLLPAPVALGETIAPEPWLAAEAEVLRRGVMVPLAEVGGAAAAGSWWLPTRPKLLFVVAALAAAAPPISRKPADRTPTLSDLRTQVFIVGYWPFQKKSGLMNG